MQLPVPLYLRQSPAALQLRLGMPSAAAHLLPCKPGPCRSFFHLPSFCGILSEKTLLQGDNLFAFFPPQNFSRFSGKNPAVKARHTRPSGPGWRLQLPPPGKLPNGLLIVSRGKPPGSNGFLLGLVPPPPVPALRFPLHLHDLTTHFPP